MLQSVNIVEEIKERADIIAMISRIVPLRRSGKSWSGICPFHTEKTGSFHVYEDSGHFICFGCGAKGDIITFYEKYYNVPFLDACERLAKECGIDWEPGGSFSSDKGRDRLYEANRFAGLMYYEAIKNEGNPALRYLTGRGIDRKTISKFRIGYADGSGTMLASKIGDDEDMRKAAEDAGLIYKYSGRYRDRFEGRVMFPIVNTRGKVIGFGGRDIDGKAKAKYINSAASNVYTKGSNLYGLNITQGAIREKGFAILVEGYIDLVALFMHGVQNVCAQLGTAFTQQQARLLGKYTKNVVLALDSDESGQTAALKSMDILAEEGLKVRVLSLEGAKDPDEFIRVFGKERFDNEVERAVPMYDFKLDFMKRDFDLAEADGLTDYLKAAAIQIAKLSPVEQDYYVKKLSGETGISENAITMQAQGSVNAAKTQQKRTGNITQTPKLTDELFLGILGLAATSGEALEKASAFRHLFDGTDYGGVMTAMLALKGRSGTAPTAAELSERLDEPDQAVLDMAMKQLAEGPENIDTGMIDEYFMKIELAALHARERDLKDAADDGLQLEELMEVQGRIKLLESDIRNGRTG